LPRGPTFMGLLETRAYKSEWRASARFRKQSADASAAREAVLAARHIERKARTKAEQILRGAGKKTSGFGAVRKDSIDHEMDVEEVDPRLSRPRGRARSVPVAPSKIAARLMFARLFDGRPDLQNAIRSDAPVVAVDVPDAEMLRHVLDLWVATLLDDSVEVLKVGDRGGLHGEFDVLHIGAAEPPKAGEERAGEREAVAALSLGLPLIAISPSAETHLPRAVMKSSPARLALPPLDRTTILKVVRIVTGSRCTESLDERTATALSPTDLNLAVRADRTPAECLDELRRLAGEGRAFASGRDIALDDIHGMDEAVTWARSLIRDVEAWHRGEIPWSAVDYSACLVGPSGTGKTLFASSLAKALHDRGIQIEFVACTLGDWQAADQGHLGSLLRAMNRDFQRARSASPAALMFFDEVDVFGDRSRIHHSHASYAIQVVSSFIAHLDGISGRHGLLLLGASNDLTRCDPAILRSGRLNRIIRVGLPTTEELERMFRVRLQGRLAQDDLNGIALLATGRTGADVERITNDAARFARHEGRAMRLEDLRRAVAGNENRDPDELRRTAVHEAGHLVVDLLLFGRPADLQATVASSRDSMGMTVRARTPRFAGTYDDYHRRLQTILAGRAAESLLLSQPTHGAGGVSGSDLQKAGAIAAAMVASLGLGGPFPLLYLAERHQSEELLRFPEVRAAALLELTKADKACRSILSRHRAALERIAIALMRNGRLCGEEAEAMLAANPAEDKI